MLWIAKAMVKARHSVCGRYCEDRLLGSPVLPIGRKMKGGFEY